MFRGGRVPSYGTGIASGLADGGMPDKRGLVIEPGGYAGKTSFKTGAQIMDELQAKPWLNLATALPEEYKSIYDDELSPEEMAANTAEFEESISDENNTWEEYLYRDVKNRVTGEITKHKYKNPNYDAPHEYVTLEAQKGKPERRVKRYLTEEELATVTTGEDNPFGYKESDVIEDLSTIKVVPENGNEPIEPEVSAEEAVAANKKLFGELLGLDKARGQDIGDMLIGASAKLLKPGATVKGGLGEFMEAESQRPSRRQKLQDTAAGLAIQDYIAGKRSKEATELMMTKMDREYEKKFEMAMPSKDDTLQVAKLKLLSLKQDPSGTKGIKYLIGVQDPENVDNVFTAKKGLKLKDVAAKKSKILKYLNPGYNILTDADRGKIIIKYDGSGTVGGVSIVTLTDLWAKA